MFKTPSRVAVYVIVLISALTLGACSDAIGDKYVGFAQCLTDKNTTMYGAYWCPHCTNQKNLFGKKGFEEVNYVECDPRGRDANPQLCAQKKIKGYPTWEFGDGSVQEGEMTLAQLAEKTSCSLPAIN